MIDKLMNNKAFAMFVAGIEIATIVFIAFHSIWS